MEIFREIKGYNGKYKISNLGRIYSNFDGGRILKPTLNRNGYLHIGLYSGGRPKRVLVHRLVALAFVPGYFDGAEVNHIDEDKTNNTPENLEWCSRAENMQHSFAKHFLITFPCGRREEVFNLRAFCREHNLHQGSMVQVAKGRFKQHKGFKCKKLHRT